LSHHEEAEKRAAAERAKAAEQEPKKPAAPTK
jgi:hypothetical protein